MNEVMKCCPPCRRGEILYGVFFREGRTTLMYFFFCFLRAVAVENASLPSDYKAYLSLCLFLSPRGVKRVSKRGKTRRRKALLSEKQQSSRLPRYFLGHACRKCSNTQVPHNLHNRPCVLYRTGAHRTLGFETGTKAGLGGDHLTRPL